MYIFTICNSIIVYTMEIMYTYGNYIHIVTMIYYGNLTYIETIIHMVNNEALGDLR